MPLVAMFWLLLLQPPEPPTIDEQIIGRMAPLVAVALSPDGHLLAVGNEHGSLALYDVRSRSTRGGAQLQDRSTLSLAFAADGQRLSAAWEGGSLASVDVATITGRFNVVPDFGEWDGGGPATLRPARHDARGDRIALQGSISATLWVVDLRAIPDAPDVSILTLSADIALHGGALGEEAAQTSIVTWLPNKAVPSPASMAALDVELASGDRITDIALCDAHAYATTASGKLLAWTIPRRTSSQVPLAKPDWTRQVGAQATAEHALRAVACGPGTTLAVGGDDSEIGGMQIWDGTQGVLLSHTLVYGRSPISLRWTDSSHVLSRGDLHSTLWEITPQAPVMVAEVTDRNLVDFDRPSTPLAVLPSGQAAIASYTGVMLVDLHNLEITRKLGNFKDASTTRREAP